MKCTVYAGSREIQCEGVTIITGKRKRHCGDREYVAFGGQPGREREPDTTWTRDCASHTCEMLHEEGICDECGDADWDTVRTKLTDAKWLEADVSRLKKELATATAEVQEMGVMAASSTDEIARLGARGEEADAVAQSLRDEVARLELQLGRRAAAAGADAQLKEKLRDSERRVAEMTRIVRTKGDEVGRLSLELQRTNARVTDMEGVIGKQAGEIQAAAVEAAKLRAQLLEKDARYQTSRDRVKSTADEAEQMARLREFIDSHGQANNPIEIEDN